MAAQNLTPELVRELLDYNPQTGDFVRKVSRMSNKIGTSPGHRRNGGYHVIFLANKLHLAHRLAWLHFYGSWPKNNIDHINGNGLDNRIENLRDATYQENGQNIRRAKTSNKSCGVLGVSPHQGKWAARITVEGKTKRLGCYDTIEEAYEAYLQAKRKLHVGCTI